MLQSSVIRVFLGLVLSQVQNNLSDLPFDPWADRPELKSFICEAQGECTVPKGCFNSEFPDRKGDVPPNDYRSPVKIKWSIDYKNQWFRKENSRSMFFEGKNEFVPTYTADLYDGEIYKRYTPREKNTSEHHTPSDLQPDLKIKTKDDIRGTMLTSYDLPVFLIQGPIMPEDLNLWEVAASKDKLTFSGKEFIRERECFIWKSKPEGPHGWFQVFWIDPMSGNSIVRWQNFVKGNHIAELIDIDYALEPNGWLPKKIRITNYDPDMDNLIYSYDELTVTTILKDVAFQKSDFQVPILTGMIITQGQKTFKATDGGLAEVDFPPSLYEWSGSSFKYYYVLLIVILGLVLFGIIKKYKGQKY